MAYDSPKIESLGGNIVRIYHPEPVEPSTNVTATIAAGGTALTVENNSGFVNKDILLFEGFGNENAELKSLTATDSAGTALTVTAVTFGHAIDTGITKVLFDQLEISGATSSGGAKANAVTVDINASGNYTDYVLSSALQADSFLYVRFYNSQAASPFYSAYSDELPTTGYTETEIGFIRRNAFKNIGEEFGGRWDEQWVYDQLYLCELDVLKSKARWGAMTVYDNDLGDVTLGMEKIALPTNIDDNQTNQSILGFRIGTQTDLDFVEYPEFQNIMVDTAISTLNGALSGGETSLTLTDSNDFEDSGSINIAGTSYAYTTNTRSTNVLSGVDTLAATDDGTNIWQGMTFGEPRRFTVSNDNVYFDVAPSSDWVGRNIWIDYVKTAVRPDSDTDDISFKNAQMYISWLEAAIKKEKGNGILPPDDNSMIDFQQQKQKTILQDKIPNGLKMVPLVPVRLTYKRSNNRR